MRLWTLICLLAVALLPGACKKDDDTTPNNGVGDNDYIEFKLNDTLRQIVAGKPKSGVAFILSQTLPAPYLYLEYIDSADGYKRATLFQFSDKKIQKKRYVYTPVNNVEYPSIVFYPRKPAANYYNTHFLWARGYMEITRMDSLPGGKIEGTFAYDSVRYLMPLGGMITDRNRITEGKFRVTLP